MKQYLLCEHTENVYPIPFFKKHSDAIHKWISQPNNRMEAIG